MVNIDELGKEYLDAKYANNLYLDYLKKCRITLLFFDFVNRYKGVVDTTLVNEARVNTKMYIYELKEDRFNLRVFGRIISRMAKYGEVEFDDELAELMRCMHLKAISISDAEEYYIDKIRSQVTNKVYNNPRLDPEIEQYNSKMNLLMMKLSNNSLDNN